MTDIENTAEPAAEEFVWHPEYAGRSVDTVRRGLTDEIRRDQSAYHLALENAEKEEHGAFTSVRDLEKRWSEFDFGWFDTPPEALAHKITDFEWERESRQEMISWREWRADSPQAPAEVATNAPEAVDTGDWRERMTEEQRKRLASALSIGVILGMVLICIVLYSVVR